MSAGTDQAQTLPREFGYYVLMHEIARGGMGAVYLARTSGIVGIEKWCVLKMLRGDLTGDTDYAARFIDEARVVVTFSHRNICQVFDVGRTDGSYYLAMERVPGRDLRSVLAAAEEKGVRFSTSLALHVAGEILEALDYAHRVSDPLTNEPLGIVHRDVSPANVMLSHEGEVKLIDFGLARSTKKKIKTDPSFVLGKAAYMPPEQMCADPLDGRADQFSAGVVAYELLTGRRYYEGISPSAIFGAATLGEFRPAGWDTLDPALRAIIGRATDASAAGRYESCGAFRDALVAYAHERFVPAGMRELRALMTELFPKDGDEFRALLAKLKQLAPAHVASRLGPQSITETIAMSPKSDPALRKAAVKNALKQPSPFLADGGASDSEREATSGTMPMPTAPIDSSTESIPFATSPSSPPSEPLTPSPPATPTLSASPLAASATPASLAPASSPDWNDLIPNATHTPRGDSGTLPLPSEGALARTMPMPIPVVEPPRRFGPIAFAVVVVVVLLGVIWYLTSLQSG